MWLPAARVRGSLIARRLSQKAQNIRIIFVQRRPNVFDVGPTLYKCYTTVLYLLIGLIIDRLAVHAYLPICQTSLCNSGLPLAVRHLTLAQHRHNAGPSSFTLAQNCANSGWLLSTPGSAESTFDMLNYLLIFFIHSKEKFRRQFSNIFQI